MEIKKLKLCGVYEFSLDKKYDKRGHFVRIFDKNIFKKVNISNVWVQENSSFTIKKNTIRGLHMQLAPFDEAKLVRCIKGKILDVYVDLRKESKTFGKWGSITLDSSNMIYIPRGFAHGFCTLEDNCSVFYKVDNYYNQKKECGILWNDIDLNINWPTNNPIISDKDNKNLSLKEFIQKYN